MSCLQRHGGAGGQLEPSASIESETAGNFLLPATLRGLMRSFDHATFGAWPDHDLPALRSSFTYWGHSYMIAPSSIRRVGCGLYTLTDTFVPWEAYVTLMLFCGPEYTWG